MYKTNMFEFDRGMKRLFGFLTAFVLTLFLSMFYAFTTASVAKAVDITPLADSNSYDNCVMVSAGTTHTAYITGSGTLYTVGGNEYGQLGDGSTTDSLSPIIVAEDAAYVSAGAYHSAYITASKDLYTFGDNWYGELGDGTTSDSSSPVLIASDVASVSCGAAFSAYVTTSGDLYTFGFNDLGQLGRETSGEYDASPTLVATGVSDVSCGDYHMAYISNDGKLYTCGGNSFGQLGNGQTSYDGNFTPSEIADNVASVSCGHYHSAYITTDGGLYTFGSNETGQLGRQTDDDFSSAPALVDAENVVSVSCGGHTAYVNSSGDLYTFGDNDCAQLLRETEDSYDATPALAVSSITAVSCGYSHTAYITSAGGLYVGGNNDYGQIGDGNTASSSDPILINGNVWNRLYGSSRYDTMKAIFEESWDGNVGGTLIVASGAAFPDALAASVLAGATDAVLVLTSKTSLSTQAQEVIEEMQPSKVYVVGGKGAVSENAYYQIKWTCGIMPTRVSGDNRIETSLAILDEVKSIDGSSLSDTVIVAYGYNFADALSVSSYAFVTHSPIILVGSSKDLSDDSISAIKKAGFSKAVITGGAGAVSSSVENQLVKLGISSGNITRLAGASRYETSSLIAQFATGTGEYSGNEAVLSYDKSGIATGKNFPDALAGAALCGKNAATLMLVADSSAGYTCINDNVTGNVDSISKGYIFGGKGAVSWVINVVLENITQ